MGKRRNNPLQLAFNILPIDEKATRRAVEDYLEEVRQYRQIGFIRLQAAMTPSYVPRYHGAINVISNPTENAAVWNVDREAELKKKSELLDLSMSQLSSVQREVIERSYLDKEGEFDYISCGEMGISESTYRRVKSSALYFLAFAMNIEIYNHDGTEAVSS